MRFLGKYIIENEQEEVGLGKNWHKVEIIGCLFLWGKSDECFWQNKMYAKS